MTESVVIQARAQPPLPSEENSDKKIRFFLLIFS